MTLRRILTLPWRRAMMWRTSLGFGIHSPFAFGFVRNVLRNPHPFYAFRREITSADERRLFRVVNYFNPQTVALIGNETEGPRRVIARCCPLARFVSDATGSDFVYLAPGADAPDEFKVVYAANMVQSPPRAMVFSNGREGIAIRRHSLPAQTFLLNF